MWRGSLKSRHYGPCSKRMAKSESILQLEVESSTLNLRSNGEVSCHTLWKVWLGMLSSIDASMWATHAKSFRR